MSEAARRRLTLAVQLLVSIVLAAFALRQVDLTQLRDLPLGTGSAAVLLAAVLLFNLSKVAGALRLNLYQRHAGILLSERENLKLYYAGMFLNLLLPGGIGGDGYKILVLLRRGAAPVRTLLAITLFDRFSGLLVLGLLTCLLLPALDLEWASQHVRLLAAAASIAVIIALLAGHRFVLKMHGGTAFLACLYAAAVQVLQMACIAVLLAGLQVPATYYLPCLAVFLASSVAAALPISLGGLGAREVTFLYGLQWLGMAPAGGVLASAAFFLITVLSSLIGLVFLRGFSIDLAAVQERQGGSLT